MNVYDPEPSSTKFKVARRLLRLIRVCAVHGVASFRRSGVPSPERLRKLFEDLGGTFLKFGQMLALQPDLIPIEYCTALFNLLDRMPPFAFAEVERTFTQELGKPATELFDSINPEPLATASIGQVHVAMLRGRKYAVKVRRPSAALDFWCDLRLMKGAIRLIRMLHLRGLYWLIVPMSEFADWTEEELDYRNEARYMLKQSSNAQDNPNEHIPDVLVEFTTRRTLVAEFFHGETVLSYLRGIEAEPAEFARRLAERGFDANRIAANIIDNFLRDVFLHGMFHADLHPANLLILRNNAIGYIDFGITGTISRYSRNTLVALTLAYTRGDLAGMGEAFLRVSTTDKRFRPERFRAGIEHLAKTWYVSQGSKRRLRKNFTLVMLDMSRLSRQTGIWPARDVVKYIRSAIAVDGLITRMAPDFDLGSHLETACSDYLKWELQRGWLGRDAMVDFVVSSLNLLGSGGRRTVGLLERVGNGEAPAPAGAGGYTPDPGRLRLRALSLSGLLVALALVAAGESPRWGWNEFTVQAGMLVGTTSLLLWTLKDLAIER